MQNLDSLSLKFFYEENKNFLNGAVIQKIQMPGRLEIIFYLRNQGLNKKIYININPKFPHICFIKDKSDIKIPKNPPMFCMLLRKYLQSAKIAFFNCVLYERILEFHFNSTDEFGISNACILAVELMGKHSNVILYNKKNGLIIGSAHNISKDKSSLRQIYGGIKYIYPPRQNKIDVLKLSYLEFSEHTNDDFYYFSKPFIEFLKSKAASAYELFNLMQKAVCNDALIKSFWKAKSEIPMNDILYDYYHKAVLEDLIANKKNHLIKTLNAKLKKTDAILKQKIDCSKYEKYKKSGDLILQYIYKINPNAKKITVENFEIELDNLLTPAQNAQKYYKLYNKLKAAKNSIEKLKQEALIKKQYYSEVLFAVQNASDFDTLLEITEELFPENSSDSSKKTVIQPVVFKGYKIFTGKNNKQNDYLIKKLSNSEDIWLHALNAPSAHCIIKMQNNKDYPIDEVLLYCAKLVKDNSFYKNSGKAPIIYTKRKFIKRPPDTPPGYVTYRNEKEIIV